MYGKGLRHPQSWSFFSSYPLHDASHTFSHIFSHVFSQVFRLSQLLLEQLLQLMPQQLFLLPLFLQREQPELQPQFDVPQLLPPQQHKSSKIQIQFIGHILLFYLNFTISYAYIENKVHKRLCKTMLLTLQHFWTELKFL